VGEFDIPARVETPYKGLDARGNSLAAVFHPGSGAVVSQFCILKQLRTPPGHRLYELGVTLALYFGQKGWRRIDPSRNAGNDRDFATCRHPLIDRYCPPNPRTDSTLANASSRACLSGGPRPTAQAHRCISTWSMSLFHQLSILSRGPLHRTIRHSYRRHRRSTGYPTMAHPPSRHRRTIPVILPMPASRSYPRS